MNIDFSSEKAQGGLWWQQSIDPADAPVQPEVTEEEAQDFDFSGELTQYRTDTQPYQIYQDFEEDPEPIDVFDPDAENTQDAMLAGLTNVAYRRGRKPLTRPPRTRRDNNPFFYYRKESFAESVGFQKATVEEPQKEALQHIDQEVEDRLKTYEKELASDLEKNIERVREFFLTEVDPLSLGIQGGTAQVHSLMLRLFPEGIDTEQFMQFTHMAKLARRIKMANFIAEYMGLSAEDASLIADSLTPKKEVMVIGPNADERIAQQNASEGPERRPRTRERIRMAGDRERVSQGEISARAPRGGM